MSSSLVTKVLFLTNLVLQISSSSQVLCHLPGVTPDLVSLGTSSCESPASCSASSESIESLCCPSLVVSALAHQSLLATLADLGSYRKLGGCRDIAKTAHVGGVRASTSHTRIAS